MAQSGSGSSRTPFDNDLVNDPQAPRDTQPLTPRAATPPGAVLPGAALPGSTPPAGTTPGNASRHLPPQVVTHGSNNDDDAAPHVTPQRPTRRLPTGTLVGFALAGGALGVLLLSMLVRNVLPGPTNKIVYTPEDAPPPMPRVVIQPPAGDGGAQVPQREDFATRSVGEGSPSADITVDSQTSTRRSEARESIDASREISSAAGGESDESPSSSDDSNSGDGDRQSHSSSDRANSSETRSSSTEGSAQDSGASSSSSTRGVDSSGGRFSSRRGYAITPPEGYKLQRTGRRTVWRGPKGEQILVETGGTNGTPREGWERLDKALSRKYGSKYRSHGIRETTMAGKPAAVWEFEIDTPSGTQRKIDIAVHHKGRGYAVLGQAPAERFEDARPRIEAAIRSFELQQQRDAASSTRAESGRASTRRGDNDSSVPPPTRARRPDSAPRSEAPGNRNTSERRTTSGQSRREAAPDDSGEEAPPVRSEGY